MTAQSPYFTLPENFNAEQFKHMLAKKCSFLIDVLGDDLTDIQYDFLPRVLTALVTCDEFNTWDNTTRKIAMDHFRLLQMTFEALYELFRDVSAHSGGIKNFVNSLVIPASPTDNNNS